MQKLKDFFVNLFGGVTTQDHATIARHYEEIIGGQAAELEELDGLLTTELDAAHIKVAAINRRLHAELWGRTCAERRLVDAKDALLITQRHLSKLGEDYRAVLNIRLEQDLVISNLLTASKERKEVIEELRIRGVVQDDLIVSLRNIVQSLQEQLTDDWSITDYWGVTVAQRNEQLLAEVSELTKSNAALKMLLQEQVKLVVTTRAELSEMKDMNFVLQGRLATVQLECNLLELGAARRQKKVAD